MKRTSDFLMISPGNGALLYPDRRLRSDGYRGAHHSQHNRHVMGDVVDILNLLSRHARGDGTLPIRTADISEAPAQARGGDLRGIL